MKKIMLIVSAVVVIASIGYIGVYFKADKCDDQVLKYAEARLNSLELQQGIELKISTVFDDIINARVVTTDKELKTLIKAITTLRAYGMDISSESKEDLLGIVRQLKNTGYHHESFLAKLEEIARTTQVMHT